MADDGKQDLSFAALKAKQRRLRAGFPSSNGLRVHRALSWLNRSEMAGDDIDAAFIFLWIAFNAAYADERHEGRLIGERSAFADYFDRVLDCDSNHRVYTAIWMRFAHEIRLFLNNRYVFAPFWKHQNGAEGYEDWEDRFEASKRASATALKNKDTARILSTLFDRLYVLRNQLVHGGATWASGKNRDQVRDGARVLGTLVPVFIDIMMDNPKVHWGDPHYPVVD